MLNVFHQAVKRGKVLNILNCHPNQVKILKINYRNQKHAVKNDYIYNKYLTEISVRHNHNLIFHSQYFENDKLSFENIEETLF